MPHTLDDILRASAAWVWFPREGEQQNAHLQLVRYPQRLGGGVRASQVRSAMGAVEVLDHAIEATRAWGETQLTFWTNSSDSPDLEAELQRRGADHIDTVSVFALPLDDAHIVVPAGVTAEVVETLDQVRAVDAVNVPVWEQHPLDEAQLHDELAEVADGLASGEGVRVLGRLDGAPVSTGGATFVDGFVRLWGAATLPEARGRGVYRAVLAERLRAAREHGAQTALVKGRTATSAPILARAGFTNYGDERAYRLVLA